MRCFRVVPRRCDKRPRSYVLTLPGVKASGRLTSILPDATYDDDDELTSYLAVTYEVMALDADAECFGAFSHNVQPCSLNDGDRALTWSVAPHRGEHTFRFLRNGEFTRCGWLSATTCRESHSFVKRGRMVAHVWHRMEVRLSAMRCTYSIDGLNDATTRHPGQMYPAKTEHVGCMFHPCGRPMEDIPPIGRIGMISRRGQGQFAGAYRFRNLEVHVERA